MNTPRSFLWISGWSVPALIWDEHIVHWPEAVHEKIDFSQCTQPDDLPNLVIDTLLVLPEPVCIVAWSLGAFVTLEILNSVSSRIQSLHLVGVGSQFTHTEAFPYGWKQRILQRMKAHIKTNTAEVIQHFDQKVFSPSKLDKQWKQLRKKKLPVPALLCGLDYLQHFSIDRISQINLPTFLLAGENDGIILSKGTTHLHHLLPKSTLTFWRSTGHIPFWRNSHHFYNWIKNSY